MTIQINNNHLSYIQNNECVSFLYFKEIDRDDISKVKGLFIKEIYTLENHRGKSYATNLINTLVNIGKNYGYAYILLDDCTDMQTEQNLYYKLGFSVRTNSDMWCVWKECDLPGFQLEEERVLFL